MGAGTPLAPPAPLLGLAPAGTGVPPALPLGLGLGTGIPGETGKTPPPPPLPRPLASSGGLGGFANAARGFFNSTPCNTNVSASASASASATETGDDRDRFSFMPTYDNVPNPVDEVAEEFEGATVITNAANTTTAAQQTGRDFRTRRTCGSTPTRRPGTCSSTGGKGKGNLKSPSKYN